MPLGKEVSLGRRHIVLDGDPVGTQSSTAALPHFRPMPIVAKRSPISASAELVLKEGNSSVLSTVKYTAIRVLTNLEILYSSYKIFQFHSRMLFIPQM